MGSAVPRFNSSHDQACRIQAKEAFLFESELH